MKKKLMKIAKSNITFGIVGGLAFWGFGKLVDKVTNNAYKEGFSDGVDAHQQANEFANKIQEAMDKQIAEE